MNKRLLCTVLLLSVALISFAQQDTRVEVLYHDNSKAVYNYVISNKDGISVKNDEGRSLFVMYDDILCAVLHKGDTEIVLYDDSGNVEKVVDEVEPDEKSMEEPPAEEANEQQPTKRTFQNENASEDDMYYYNKRDHIKKAYKDGDFSERVYLGAGKMVSIDTDMRTIKINHITYPFDDILEYTVLENNVEHPAVYETKKKGVLGRALLGEAIAGKTGAIIGGSTAKSVTTIKPATTVTEYALKVTVADTRTPFIYIPIGEDLYKLRKVRKMFDYIFFEDAQQ